MLEKSENIIDSGKADQDQRDRKSSYRTLLENLPDIVYRLQLQGSRPMQFFNDRITEITGFSPDEFTLGRICFIESRMMKEDASRVIETVEKAIRERSPFEVEYRFLCKDGAIITLMEKGTVVCDATGAPSYIDGVIRDISDRKAMEDALRQSEDRYKAIVDSQAEFVVRYLPGGIVTFVNDTLCRYVGMKRKDLLGKSYYPFMHPDDHDTFVRKIEALNRNTPDMVAEARVVLPDGRLAWHRWSHHAIFDKDGALVEYQCTGRDVTDLKLAENKLRKSEESYRALVETANSVILTWDTEGNLMFVNDFAERFFGYTKEELIGRNVVGTIVPETESSGRNLALLMREIQKDPDGFRDNENENITKDGRRVWVQWANKALVDDKDKLTGILSIGNDITERKRTEEALQKSEKMLQTIIEAEPECVKLLDANANLIMINQAGLSMLEAESFNQVKGQCVCPMLTAECRPAFMDLTRRVFQGDSGTLVFEIVGLKGKHLWLETHAVPLRNEKDEIVALLGVTRDITDWRLADEALRASESRFRTIIESATSGILVADVATRKFVYANPEICHMLGYPREELLKLGIHDIHPVGEMPRVVKSFSIRNEVQTLCRRKDGATFPVDIKPVAIELEGKQCLAGFFSDISEKLMLEEERLKTQKLESIGTLAGGIAHDFNNLLQGLFGYISMAKMALDRPERVQTMLEQAEEALRLSVNLTTQLLTFAKGGKPIKKLIRIRPLIENAVKFSLSGSHTDWQLNMTDDLWPVEADEGQLSQVLQNMVLNANEAMAGRGTVQISAENREIPAGTASGLPQGGPAVRIMIQDSGIGIPSHNLSRIFDPYFTTKQKGSGLGLATSYSIIKNHGGNIAVKSKLNRGSTFTIYLPAARDAKMSTEMTTPSAAVAKKGKILLMDDEELVRDVARAMITVLDHEVQCAKDGKQAIELYRQRKDSGDPFDLVILDLTVKGGMGGEEAIGILRQIDPGIVAVVSSGYADSPVVANYKAYGFAAYLNKPYRIAELRDCLTALLKQS